MDPNETSERRVEMNLIKLIQPELLSKEELVDILRQRSVQPDLLNQGKDQLVSLFRRVAFPLPQRIHRQNSRGILLTKIQKKMERLNTCKFAVNDTSSYTVGVSGPLTASEITKEDKGLNGRLKPPPELINYERKKIRLNRTSSAAEQSGSELDKIVIKKRKVSESSDSCSDKNNVNLMKKPVAECVNSVTNIDTATEVDRETLHSNVKSNGTKSDKPAKVSLKRNHLVASDKTTNAEPEATAELNKRRKPITWP